MRPNVNTPTLFVNLPTYLPPPSLSLQKAGNYCQWGRIGEKGCN